MKASSLVDGKFRTVKIGGVKIEGVWLTVSHDHPDLILIGWGGLFDPVYLHPDHDVDVIDPTVEAKVEDLVRRGLSEMDARIAVEVLG